MATNLSLVYIDQIIIKVYMVKLSLKTVEVVQKT